MKFIQIKQKPKLAPPEKIDGDKLRELSIIEPRKFIFALLFDITFIALAILVSEYFNKNMLAYIPAIIVIGARMHGFALLLHDAAHNRAFKSKKLNVLFGEPLAWVNLVTLESYKDNHLKHHKHLNSETDPDWVVKQGYMFTFPKKESEVVKILFRKLCGIGLIDLLQFASKNLFAFKSSNKVKYSRLAFYFAVVFSSFYFGFLVELLLYWFVPFSTTFSLIMYIRSVSEHHGNMEYGHTYTHSRNVICNPLEKFIFSPHNGGYHLDHHLYPSVPFYNLPKLHQVLLQEEVYKQKAHITKGMSGVFKEFSV